MGIIKINGTREINGKEIENGILASKQLTKTEVETNNNYIVAISG